MIIQKFLRDHPHREFNQDTGQLQRDVLAVEMRAAPTERRFYGQLLLALNAPYRPGDRLAAVEFMALTVLRQGSPKMIVVDGNCRCAKPCESATTGRWWAGS